MKYTFFLITLFCSVTLYGQPYGEVNLFSLENVRLSEGPFLQAQQTDLKYILELEPDRLLAPYLREAGLPVKAPSYTNWENSGLDGHIGGHYLSALAMMYASTGEAEMKTRLDYMIDELKSCQDVVGTGFIGGTPGSIQLWEEIKAGNIRAGGFDLNGKWVPLYNIHKTYAGLRDAYLYAGNRTAFDMLIKMTDWMIDITSGLSDEQMQDMLRSEHGGLNEVFADLYALTARGKYLQLARRFSHLQILNPLIAGEDRLTGLHANTQIPKVLGYKRIADMEGNRDWDNAARFFWETVTEKRSVCIGGNSVREHFHPVDNFSSMVRDIQGPETCNTYNMLRLSNMLFRSSADTRYIDYYERALYNHILASQEPEQGGFVYFTPMRPGHYRVYSQPETSMWCCVGSGLENHAKYGELIYAYRDNELFVNLFIPSRLVWEEQNIILSMETAFPDENQLLIRFDQADKKEVILKIRNPEWVGTGEVVAEVNGKRLKSDAFSCTDGYLAIERKWKSGDEVRITLPMQLRCEQLPDHSGYYAFTYGPIVLATPLGTEDMRGLYADDSRGGHIAHGKQISLQEVPTLIGEAGEMVASLKRVEGDNLRFSYTGTTLPEQSLEFIPFFRLHNSRYAVYLHQLTVREMEKQRAEMEKREYEAARLASQTVDLIYPGEQQPESDHFVRYEGSKTGTRGDRHYREATGWFSYKLKITDESCLLRLIRHKEDVKLQTEIRINDQIIVASPETEELGDGFISLSYQLPKGLATGEQEIRFSPEKSPSTGKIYEIRILNCK